MLRHLAFVLLLLAAPAGTALALEPTPAQTEGPFYPRRKPAETDTDLTRIGNGPAAKGQELALRIEVVDTDGKPIEEARVEIWQTDHQGIYLHPGDPNHQRRDANFQAYGEGHTDAGGLLQFTTIRPPPYGGRPAHIHVKVTPPKGTTLTTQLYFADDPGLARDGIAKRLGKALERVTLRPRVVTRGQEAQITLVVRRGRGSQR